MMAKEGKKGFLSRYLLKAGEALLFRPMPAWRFAMQERMEKTKEKMRSLVPYKLKIKTALAKNAEQSFVLSSMREGIRCLLHLRVRSFGVLFFSCGFLQILSFFLRNRLPFAVQGSENLVCGVSLLFLTLLCSFSRGDLCEALKKSFLFRAILRPVFRLEEWQLPIRDTYENIAGMFLSGVLIAVLSVLFSPTFVLLLLLCLAVVLFVFFRPEAGFLSAVVLLPVIPASFSVGLLITSLLSLLCKCAIGKRSLSLSLMDAAVLIALLPLFVLYGRGALPAFVALFSAYYCLSCLIRTAEGMRQLELVVVLSALFCGLFFVLRQAVLSLFPSLFRLAPRIYSLLCFQSPEKTGVILAMLIPLVLGVARFRRGKDKLLCSVTLIVSGVGLFFVKSGGIWLAALSGVAVYLLISFRAALTGISLFALSAVTALQALPTHWSRRFLAWFGVRGEEWLFQGEHQGFFGFLRENVGAWGIFLCILLFLCFALSCFCFCVCVTQKKAYPLVAAGIASLAVFTILSLLNIAYDFCMLAWFLCLLALPAAARHSYGREEARDCF